MKVGYVGLGIMGGALAKRLLQSRPLLVFDLNRNVAASLAERGAAAAENLSNLAAAADVVMLCLPRSSNVREAIFGTGGLIEGLKPGSVIVDQTSGDPRETREMAVELADLDIDMVDAPVSGGAIGAEAGTIAIMTGGPEAAVSRVRPVLAEISPNIFHCGGIGAGQVMKLINNTISTCNRFAMLEGVAMGLRSGLDLETMTNVLNAGGARSKATEKMLPALAKGKPESAFLLSLMLKDLDLAVSLAEEAEIPVSFGRLAREMLQSTSDTYGPDADLFSISEHVATRAGVAFRPSNDNRGS